MDVFDDRYAEAALYWAAERYPGPEWLFHRCAFANAVNELMTGVDPGYGGPSMRQIAAGILAGRNIPEGGWTQGEAFAFCEPICFGPITLDAARVLLDQDGIPTNGDPPGDVEAARKLLEESGELGEDEFL